MTLSLVRLSQASAVALTALAVLGIAAARPAAAQNLNGQPVNVSQDTGMTGPTSPPNLNLGTQTITPGGETYTDSFDSFSIVVTPAQVVITCTAPGGQGFAGDPNPGDPDYFFGYALTETGSSPATITGLSIDPATTVAGFDPSRLSFTPTAAYANFNDFQNFNNGLEFQDGQNLTLDLSFTPTTPAVPEPSTVLPFAFGALGLGGLVAARRRKTSEKAVA